MIQSNIKIFIYAHTYKSVGNYLGLSRQTLSAWVRRGYCNPAVVNKLAAYPCGIMTADEFLKDIKDNINENND